MSQRQNQGPVRRLPQHREAGGGLTIYLQPDSPGPSKQANWLPTSATYDWFVILRLYRPHPAVIEATWKCPGISRVNEKAGSSRKPAEEAG
jgi:hypothetical protein